LDNTKDIMSNKLILMRHGRSLLNDGYQSSERNNVLTWRGVLATLSEAEPLKSENVTQVLASPVPRAYQTAMLAVGALGRGVDISLHPELREIDPKDHDLDGPYEDDASSRNWKHAIDMVPNWGTESQRDVYRRATGFLIEALPQALAKGSVLVVSHYFTLRGIRSWIEHGNPDEIPTFRPKNSMPVIYQGEDVMRRIAGEAAKINRLRN